MPHKAKFAILKKEEVKGMFIHKPPIERISWEFIILWIIEPAHINNKALNIAWVKRWKKANLHKPIDKIIIIKPNWLKVDKAIIFLNQTQN